MKRVLFILPSLSKGGSERVFSIFANLMDDAGYSVGIVFMHSNEVAYPIHPTIQFFFPQISRKSFFHKLFGSFKKLDHVIRDFHPDLIIDPNYYRYSVWLARLRHIPIILSYRNDATRHRNHIRFFYKNLLFHMADYCFFQTETIRSCFISVAESKSTVIPNPLSEEIPAPYQGTREKDFVAVCRLEAQKNIPMLLRAFAKFSQAYPDYDLKIYGVGALQSVLEAQTVTLQIADKVRFMGFQTNVFDLIQKATAYCSSSDYEGLSNAMIEAMALGLPCIVTDCNGGGAREIIQDGENGILVPINDAEAMCAGMERVASDPAFAASLSINAEKIREKLSLKAITPLWWEMIHAVLPESGEKTE